MGSDGHFIFYIPFSSKEGVLPTHLSHNGFTNPETLGNHLPWNIVPTNLLIAPVDPVCAHWSEFTLPGFHGSIMRKTRANCAVCRMKMLPWCYTDTRGPCKHAIKCQKRFIKQAIPCKHAITCQHRFWTEPMPGAFAGIVSVKNRCMLWHVYRVHV